MTGRDSRPIPDKQGGYFIERIQQGAFLRAMKKAKKINALLDHEWGHVIGDTESNLKLKEDVIGLRAHLETSDPEVLKLAKEKRLRGWSFDIINPSELRSEGENNMPIRTITDFDMSEISLISDKMKPWYESTTVETRAGEKEKEIRVQEMELNYVGFEKKKYDKESIKEIIKKYGGKI